MRYFRVRDTFGVKVWHFFLPNEFQTCRNPFRWLARKYFSGQSTRRSSQVILSPFYTKWFSSLIEREDFCEEFQKKRFDEAAEIANHNMGDSNVLFHQFSRWFYRRYIIKLTSVMFFLKIGINLYSKSRRFLYCYFWLRGKPVENTSLSLLIISARSLHNFWNFPRYANHRCIGHATISTERGNDWLITVHAPSC